MQARSTGRIAAAILVGCILGGLWQRETWRRIAIGKEAFLAHQGVEFDRWMTQPLNPAIAVIFCVMLVGAGVVAFELMAWCLQRAIDSCALPRPVSGAIRGLDAKAIVVGLTAAFVVGTALTWIRNEDQLLRDHDELPLARYLSVLVGGAFSQFLGGFIAGRMASGHQLKNGLVVAVPLFVLQLALFSVPSVFPDWGRVVSLIGVLPTTILGSVAAMRRPRSATSSV